MQAPTNIKQIRAFLGMVGYYRDMWPRCSHILAPLTDLTGKKAFVWEDKHQQAFEQMKALIATDARIQIITNHLISRPMPATISSVPSLNRTTVPLLSTQES
jgi:hypothetical protein